jgi:phosphatidylserine/phosphatidylglycerophosphate/cardiolipin synthase-like enzyme
MLRFLPTSLLLFLAVALQAAEQPLPQGATVEAAFSPGHALETVLGAISEAHDTILVAAYTFTSRPIADALVAAKERGVHVLFVADARELHGKGSLDLDLVQRGIPVRLDRRYAIHHHKFLVIDGQTVELGSFNFTAAAAKHNAENLVVLRHVPELAATYSTEWHRLWDESEELKKAEGE